MITSVLYLTHVKTSEALPKHQVYLLGLGARKYGEPQPELCQDLEPQP